jgi:hypothetical protein
VAAGDLNAWDGLCGWFREFVSAHPDVLKHAAVRRWHKALRSAPTHVHVTEG